MVALLIVAGAVCFWGFKSGDSRSFQIAKNLDIFNSIVKELDMFYVDTIDPNKTIREGIDAMLYSLDPYTEYYPPMLGFLGTVTGMVRAFYEMANAGSGNIDITLLSGGIYEAMITTVGGLIVGIIAMFAYNYLVMLVDRVVNKMESRTMEFMDLLNEPAQK